MTKKEKIEKFIEKYNGYLITSLVCREDISKTYVAKYIKEHGMEKVSRGVYITDDVWPDELFILQQRNGAIIYSGETALYLHGLTDREDYEHDNLYNKRMERLREAKLLLE